MYYELSWQLSFQYMIEYWIERNRLMTEEELINALADKYGDYARD